MSKKTYVEAIEYVLDSELDARGDLICLRPGARRALEEADRDMPLPRMGRHSFSVALGAALQGMHPVLDLRQEHGAAELLREALMELPADVQPVMTVILCAGEGAETLPGVYVFAPKTPRQAAGFMRSALKMNRLTLLLADQTLFAEEDDIPEDRGFTLLPLDGEEGGLNGDEPEEVEAPEEEAAEAPEKAQEPALAEKEEADLISEEEAYDEAEAEDVPVLLKKEAPEFHQEPQTRHAVHAFRQTRCDLKEIRALCALLDMQEQDLIDRCAAHVRDGYDSFELHCETDAPAGEAAFLPPAPASVASVWLGSDMLTISYDALRLLHCDAAELLRAMKRVIEKPQLLVYDKELENRKLDPAYGWIR